MKKYILVDMDLDLILSDTEVKKVRISGSLDTKKMIIIPTVRDCVKLEKIVKSL